MNKQIKRINLHVQSSDDGPQMIYWLNAKMTRLVYPFAVNCLMVLSSHL